MLSAFLQAGFAFFLLFLVFFVAERHNKQRKRLWIMVALCVAAASACVAWLAVQARPPEYEQVCIQATRRQNSKARENALYLTGVYLGDRAITLFANEEACWNLSGNWYVWRDQEADATEPLSTDDFCFDIPAGRQRSLEFFTNASKGIVQIRFQEETWEVDCYSESDGRIRVDLPDTPTEQLARQLRNSVFTFLLVFVLCVVLLLSLWFGLCWIYDRTGKARLRYEELWTTLSGWRGFLFYTAHYTALFGVLSVLIFLPFITAGKTFLWEIDAVPQYLPNMIRQSQTFRESLASLIRGDGWIHSAYDFNTGLVRRSVLLDPLMILSAFWPLDQMDCLYPVLILLPMYAAGLSMSALAFRYRQKPMPVLIGAVAYAFCDFSLFFGVRHLGFAVPMVLLPLLIIGVEKLVRKERPYLFIALVFFSMAYSPYFAGMLAVLTILYAAVRWVTLHDRSAGKETVSFFLRFFGSGLLGCILSGAILIPYLITIAQMGRAGQNLASAASGGIADQIIKTYLVFPEAYYKKFLSAFLVEPGHTYYSLCLGFSVLSLPALSILYYGKNRDKRTLRVSLIVVTILALSPLAAYVMSGFSTYSHRWSYAYALAVSFVLIRALPEMVEIKWKRDFIVITVILAWVVICCAMGGTYRNTALPGILLLLAGWAVFCIARCFGMRQAMGAALVVTCASVCFTAFLLYDPGQRDYTAEFVDKNLVYEYYNNSIYGIFSSSDTADDGEFYRVSGSGITPQSLGSAKMFGVNGMTYQSSGFYQGYGQWINGMETIARDERYHHYGPGNRLGVLSLSGVKYYVWRDSDGEVMPYGFEKAESVGNPADGVWILENRYWLPVGFTTTAYLTQAEYALFSAIEKQEAQLQAVVLNDLPANTQQYEHLDFVSRAEQIPVRIAARKGVKLEDGVLSVNRQNAVMELAFNGKGNCECYLRVVGLDLTQSGASENWVLSADAGNGTAYAHFYSDDYLYSPGLHNQILNLGYSESGLTSCTLTFPKSGTYQLEELEIWCVPTDQYVQQINLLSEETLENVRWGRDQLTGDISVSSDRLLQIALPYCAEWHAYVDGEETEIYQADVAWMAIELKKGDHTVELHYQRAGRTAGWVLSAIGVVVLISLVLQRKSKPSNDMEGGPCTGR